MKVASEMANGSGSSSACSSVSTNIKVAPDLSTLAANVIVSIGRRRTTCTLRSVVGVTGPDSGWPEARSASTASRPMPTICVPGTSIPGTTCTRPRLSPSANQCSKPSSAMTWGFWLGLPLTGERIDGAVQPAGRACPAVVPKMTVSPPSTTCSDPVVNADSSDARYTMSAAMWSGTPRQPSGMPAVAVPGFIAV
jgi:hypothetical protein